MGKDLPKEPQGKSKIFSAWYVLTRGGDGGGGGGGGGGGSSTRCCVSRQACAVRTARLSGNAAW